MKEMTFYNIEAIENIISNKSLPADTIIAAKKYLASYEKKMKRIKMEKETLLMELEKVIEYESFPITATMMVRETLKVYKDKKNAMIYEILEGKAKKTNQATDMKGKIEEFSQIIFMLDKMKKRNNN